ncbi:MAG: alpha/beta fold hydrolase [Paracoccaceae bacterium]
MPRFTSSDGLSLFYTDTGHGPPLLCLSGLTRNLDDFHFVSPHLSMFRLIKLDYRGRGRSDWAADYKTYMVPREAADALELLDHLNIDKTAILGTSRGGIIAMFLAHIAKNRLSAVALNDIGPELQSTGLDDIFAYLGRPPAAKTLEEAARMRAAHSPGFEHVPTERWRAEAANLYVETPFGLDLRYDAKLRDAVIEQQAALPNPDLWPLFKALDGLPLALIHGVNSDLLSAASVEKMQAYRPDMILAKVPNRGHIPFLDEPQALDALHKWSTLIKNGP